MSIQNTCFCGEIRKLFSDTPSYLELWFVFEHVCLFVLRLYGPVNPMGSCSVHGQFI